VNATSGPQTVAGTISVYAQTSIVSRSAATSGLVVRGATSQASNYQEWQNSGGTVVASLSATSSTFKTAGGVVAGGASASTIGVLNGYTTSASGIGLFLKGAASQTADLIQLQDNSAGTVFAVRSDGKQKVSASNIATTVGATGTASALPALPVGYVQIDIAGTLYKMPYYNN
jgi:hypothetical protein